MTIISSFFLSCVEQDPTSFNEVNKLNSLNTDNTELLGGPEKPKNNLPSDINDQFPTCMEYPDKLSKRLNLRK